MASTYQDKNGTNLNGSGNNNTSASLSKSLTSGSSGATASSKSTSTQNTTSSTPSNYGQQISSAMASGSTFDASQYDSVTSAQNYLNEVIANKPGSYQSKYTNQLNTLYNQLLNRGSFAYNMNGDALYQSYKDRYTNAGKSAMRDTMGQAAANTGGYGSSYAQTAGQSAYNQYLQQLNEAIPTLQSQALSRYNDQTTQLQNQYNMVNSADTTAYNRNRDTVSDWENERTYAANREANAYSNTYQQWSDQQSAAQTVAGWEREDASNAKTQAQTQVFAWIQAGVKPSRAMVEAAGMDYDQTMAYYKKVK